MIGQPATATGYGRSMLDSKRFRTELDQLKHALGRRGVDPSELDRVATLTELARVKGAERDGIRARVKDLSRQVQAARRGDDEAQAEALVAESRALGEQEKQLDTDAEAAAAEARELLLRLPNEPAEEAPDGVGPDENVVLRVEGYDESAYGDHQRVPHWDIGTELGILDLERGAKMSGAMFPVYRGQGAALVRALCQLCLDRNSDTYEEIRPPTLVRTDTMIATGHLPKFEDEAYHLERDDLWAIPTAEVPLTSLGRNEIVDEGQLPLRMMAHTSCFRREAGSAGRDTRGLLRIHEFDKVELLAYASPAQARAVHEEILARAESMLQVLGLAYRVLDLCTGDLGNSAARTFDLEAYAPGCDMWLEVSSVSWFSDYQARRANLRYRPAEGKGTAMLHTLNGSGMAVPRMWAALVETYRQPDGSIEIPEALRPYMRGADRITRRA